jgi:hypothetical protein
MAASDQYMNWGSAGITAFVLAGCSEDVILLHIRQEVIILIRLASSRVALLVLLTSRRLRL